MSMAEQYLETADSLNDEINETGEENKESVYDKNIIIEDTYGYIKVDLFISQIIVSY